MLSTKHYTLASVMLLASVSAQASILAAGQHINQNQELRTSKTFKRMIPKFGYSYVDLKFNSYADNSYNLFHGFSNIYSAGLDNLQINRKTTYGLYVFQMNTRITSRTFLFPTHPINSHSEIANNTLFGHVLRKLSKRFLVDVLGSIGQNSITNNSTIEDDSHILGFSNTVNHVYLIGTTGTYVKPIKKFVFKLSLGALYNMIYSGAGTSYHNVGYPPQTIRPLTTRTGITFENVELGYRWSKTFTPFASFGLVQVPYFSNSRQIFNPAQVLGSAPQLVMNQPAYRVAAGFAVHRKNYTLRFEQRYYNSVNTLETNTTSVSLSCRFN